MSGTVSFGGLFSGLDTKNITEQLVTLRRQRRIAPLERQIQGLQTKQLVLSPLKTALTSFLTASKTLKDTTNALWNVQKATSSNTDKILVSATDGSKAVPGNYVISNISQLAQPDRVIFDGVANKDASQFGTGSLEITYNGATTTINIDSTNNTLNGILGAINNAGAGVKASIINDGDATNPYRLTLTGNNTGADYGITLNLGSLTLAVDNAATTDPANEEQNALFEVNQIAVSSNSNTISDAVPGVTLELIDTETTNNITVTVSRNISKVSEAISAFVSSYNNVQALLRANTTPDKETGQRGPLSNDVTLINARTRTANLFGKRFISLTGSYKSLTDLGITTDATNTIKIDSAKLTSALETNLSDVQAMFQGSATETGIANGLTTYVESIAGPNGAFDDKAASYSRQLIRLQAQIKDQEKRLEDYQLRTLNRFAALESQLSNLDVRQSQIDSFVQVFSNSANKLL